LLIEPSLSLWEVGRILRLGIPSNPTFYTYQTMLEGFGHSIGFVCTKGIGVNKEQPTSTV